MCCLVKLEESAPKASQARDFTLGSIYVCFEYKALYEQAGFHKRHLYPFGPGSLQVRDLVGAAAPSVLDLWSKAALLARQRGSATTATLVQEIIKQQSGVQRQPIHLLSASCHWHAPPVILGLVRAVFAGHMIDLDPCSDSHAQQLVRAAPYYTAQDGLSQPWQGRVCKPTLWCRGRTKRVQCLLSKGRRGIQARQCHRGDSVYESCCWIYWVPPYATVAARLATCSHCFPMQRRAYSCLNFAWHTCCLLGTQPQLFL